MNRRKLLLLAEKEAWDMKQLAFKCYIKLGKPEVGVVFKSPIPNTVNGGCISEIRNDINRTKALLHSILNNI